MTKRGNFLGLLHRWRASYLASAEFPLRGAFENDA